MCQYIILNHQFVWFFLTRLYYIRMKFKHYGKQIHYKVGHSFEHP